MTGADNVVDCLAPSKRDLDSVFGDVLPDTTRDDQLTGPHAEHAESAQSSAAASKQRDDEILREVPPHHG